MLSGINIAIAIDCVLSLLMIVAMFDYWLLLLIAYFAVAVLFHDDAAIVSK